MVLLYGASLVGIWAAQRAEVEWMFGAIIVMLLARWSAEKSDDAMFGVAYGCGVGAIVWLWMRGAPWVPNAYNGPDYMLYAMCVLYMTARVLQTYRQSFAECDMLHVHIHRIRATGYLIVIGSCSIVAIYYVSVVAQLLNESPDTTLSQTTRVVNATYCKQLDAMDDTSTSLYDTTPFVIECAYQVWERFRTNVLLGLQVHILFHLLIKAPFAVYGLSQTKVIVYMFMTMVHMALLFLGVTIVVDDIHDWYVIDVAPAVLLSVTVLLRAFMHVYRSDADVPEYLPTMMIAHIRCQEKQRLRDLVL